MFYATSPKDFSCKSELGVNLGRCINIYVVNNLFFIKLKGQNIMGRHVDLSLYTQSRTFDAVTGYKVNRFHYLYDDW